MDVADYIRRGLPERDRIDAWLRYHDIEPNVVAEVMLLPNGRVLLRERHPDMRERFRAMGACGIWCYRTIDPLLPAGWL